MIPQDSRSPFRQQRWLEVANVGAQLIPAFSVVEISNASRPESGGTITPSGGVTRYQAKRPTSDGLQNFMITGFQPIPTTAPAIGFATNDFPCIVTYPSTGDAPQPGETWGPKKDQFTIAKDQPGLLILGDVDTTNKLVRVLRIGVGVSVVRFQLTEDLDTGGSALAKIRRWNQTLESGTGDYEDVPDSEIRVHDWWGESDGGVASDPQKGLWQGKTGMEGWAVYRGTHSDTDHYEIIWMETFAWSHEGEAIGNIDKTGDVWKLNVSTRKAFEQGLPPDTTLDLRDYQELYPHALAGARTLAKRSEHDTEVNELEQTVTINPSYHLWLAQQMGFLCTATLAANMCDTGDVSISGVSVMTFSPFNQTPPSLTHAKNPRRHMGRIGDEVFLAYHHSKDSDGATRQWFEVVGVLKRKYWTLAADASDGALRLSGGYLQAKLVEAALETCADPDWYDQIPYVDCAGL